MGAAALEAASLMRSRYSAYVLQLESYLLATWHPDCRPAMLDLSQDRTQWLGLKVKHGLETDDAATVEFVARYKLNGRAYQLHEVSRFVREHGRWFYLDGKFQE